MKLNQFYDGTKLFLSIPTFKIEKEDWQWASPFVPFAVGNTVYIYSQGHIQVQIFRNHFLSDFPCDFFFRLSSLIHAKIEVYSFLISFNSSPTSFSILSFSYSLILSRCVSFILVILTASLCITLCRSFDKFWQFRAIGTCCWNTVQQKFQYLSNHTIIDQIVILYRTECNLHV
jgi:hypothetical protein